MLWLEFSTLHEVDVFLLENNGATREQVAIIKALLKDDLGTKHTMPLIIIVHHQQLVSLVLVQRQLGEDVVSLYVLCRETYRILDVSLSVLFHWPQVEQDDLWIGRLGRWLFRWELALSKSLHIREVLTQPGGYLSLLNVVCKSLWGDPPEVFTFELDDSLILVCLHDCVVGGVVRVNHSPDVVVLGIGPHSALVLCLVSEAVAEWEQVQR